MKEGQMPELSEADRAAMMNPNPASQEAPATNGTTGQTLELSMADWAAMMNPNPGHPNGNQ